MVIISKIFTNDKFYHDISSSINSFSLSHVTYYPSEMSDAILKIEPKRNQFNGNKWYNCISDSPFYRPRWLAQGNGIMLGIFNDGDLMKSYDGTSWKRVFDNEVVSRIVFGNGVFVAFAPYPTEKGWYSKDGEVWTKCCDFSNLIDLVFFDGVFIALPGYGPQYMRYSFDGVNWYLCRKPPSFGSKIFYTNGIFYMVSPSSFEFSENGREWEVGYTGSLNDSSPLFDPILDYHGGVWVLATQDSGIKYCTSRRPNNWVNSNIIEGDIRGVKHEYDGFWIAIASIGYEGQIFSSKDGKTWDERGLVQSYNGAYITYCLNHDIFCYDGVTLRYFKDENFSAIPISSVSFAQVCNGKIYAYSDNDDTLYNSKNNFLETKGWHACDNGAPGVLFANHKDIIFFAGRLDTGLRYSYLYSEPIITVNLSGDMVGTQNHHGYIVTLSGKSITEPGKYTLSLLDSIKVKIVNGIKGVDAGYRNGMLIEDAIVDGKDILFDIPVSSSIKSLEINIDGKQSTTMNCYDGLSENFSENDWSAIIHACKNNKVLDSWTVGNVKPLKLTDGKVMNAVIVGRDRDNAHLTMSLTMPFPQGAKLNDKLDSNFGGWTSTDFYHNRITPGLNTYKELLPNVIKNNLIPKTNKYYRKDRTGNGFMDQSTDHIWLFSLAELFQTLDGGRYYNDEGTWYSYWTSVTRANVNEFWTRTPQKKKDGGEHRRFCTVGGDGIPEHSPYETHSIVLGFCI